MAILDIFTGLGTAISGITNAASQAEANRINKEIAEKNLAFKKETYREQFDYQKYLNEEQRRREDTAQQRAMKDAITAGLNPLAATQSGTATLHTASPETPQNNYQHQAVQMFNIADIANQIYSATQMQENIATTKAERELTKQKILTEIENAHGQRLNALLTQEETAKTKEEKLRVQKEIESLVQDIEIKQYNLNKSQDIGLRTTDAMDARFNSVMSILQKYGINSIDKLVEYQKRQQIQEKQNNSWSSRGRNDTSEYVNDPNMPRY